MVWDGEGEVGRGGCLSCECDRFLKYGGKCERCWIQTTLILSASGRHVFPDQPGSRRGTSTFGSDWPRLASMRTPGHQRRAVLEQKKFEDQYFVNRR